MTNSYTSPRYSSARREPLYRSPLAPLVEQTIKDMDRRWLRRAIVQVMALVVFVAVAVFGVIEVGMGDTMPALEPLYQAAHHGAHSPAYLARGWDKGLAAARKSDARYWSPSVVVAPARSGWSIWSGYDLHPMDH
jgi:hypothetical protein